MVREVTRVRFLFASWYPIPVLIVFKVYLVVPKAIAAYPLDVDVCLRSHAAPVKYITEAYAFHHGEVTGAELKQCLLQSRKLHPVRIWRRIVARRAVVIDVNNLRR